MQCNKDAGGIFCESFVVYCLLLIDISASLKVLNTISVIISTKNMIGIPVLFFYVVQALGTAKGFINLTIEYIFYAPVNFDKAMWLL